MSEQAQQFIMPSTHAGSIIQLTDAQAELKKLELAMRGLYIDESGNIVRIGEPLMNEEGISEIFGVVSKSVVNRLTILSNFEEYEVKNQMAGLIHELAKLLLLNSKRYGIKNSTITWNLVYPSVLRVCFSCLKRGYLQGERQFWNRIGQIIESKIETIGKTKGLMSSLPGAK